MNRRRLAVRVIAVAVAVAVVPSVHPIFVSATPIDEQQARVEQLTDELEHLEETSDILAEDYVTAIDEKHRLDAEVVVAEQKVAEQEAAVAALPCGSLSSPSPSP